MRIVKTETKVYPFDELSDSAKEKAIEGLVYCNVEHDWWDLTYGDAKTIGLVIEEFDLDRNRGCGGKWTEDAEDVARLIVENHGEQCETHSDAIQYQTDLKQAKRYMKLNQHFDHGFPEFNETDEYAELCEKFLRTICEDYSIILQNEYEYLCSDESIIESIEANEWEFRENGELY